MANGGWDAMPGYWWLQNPVAQWLIQQARQPQAAQPGQPGFIGPVNPGNGGASLQQAAMQRQPSTPQWNNFLMNYTYRTPANIAAQQQALMAQQQAQQAQPDLAALYAQAGLTGALGAAGAGGAGGASLPNWNFAQWGGGGMNPLANVPLEYWDYALGSQDRALGWQQQQDYNRWKGEEIGLSKEQLALQRQTAQQQAEQWLKEFGAQNSQWSAQHQLNQNQFDWGKNTWGQEFNRANQNDAWGRASDQFNQALAAAQNDWQKRNAAQQLKVQDEGNALAAWGRRTNPLISAM